ncbi:MAG: LolA family protein [Candidatus Aminicenantes bacterium]
MTHLACLFLLLWLQLPYTAQDIALKTEKKLRSFHSIQAHFEQVYYSSTVSTPLREKGNFYFKKPDMMKWEYREPEEKIFLYKQGVFQFYIPEDNQLIRSSLSEQGHEAEILMLLSGKKRLLDSYSIEFSPFPTDHPDSWQIKLDSEQKEEYSFILLEIDKKRWLIQKAIFFDWAGNKTEFQFSQIKINVSLSPDVFDLKVPPDVEIIEEYRNQ